jgi:hypothetical protein
MLGASADAVAPLLLGAIICLAAPGFSASKSHNDFIYGYLTVKMTLSTS